MSLNYKIPVTAILLFFFQFSIAQVGINTISPGGGSMLDISATDKGVLIPRVNIADLSTQAPVTGTITTSMLVYNTNTTTGTGFYYWDGTNWVIIGSGDFWELEGNAGTTPGIAAGQNFIGTSDNQNLILARNNQNHVQLNTSETVINDASNDTDFRVEADDQENMIFVNAEDNQVFVRNTAHHIATYIDPFNAYADGVDDGSATVGIQYAIAGWNQGTLGGGINGVIEDATNLYAAIEGSTAGPGIAVRGLSATNSNAIAVRGSIPTTGTWLGFGGLFSGGLAYADGLYNLSDARVKKDINSIENALDKIINIEGISYKYDFSSYSQSPRIDNKTYYGFTAQNIKEQLPHAVVEKMIPIENATIRSIEKNELLNVVDYTAVIPVLVEAMKEQQQQIETLKLEVEALKKK